jgi:hypothetical protein
MVRNDDDDKAWFDSDLSELELRKAAAAVLQGACESMHPDGMPTDLHERLNMLFAGITQITCLTVAWARAAEKAGQDLDATQEAANKAANSLCQAATCVAMAFFEESSVDPAPQFSDN